MSAFEGKRTSRLHCLLGDGEKRTVFMARFLQPECVPRHSHWRQSIKEKWAFLYLIVVVVLTLSYSTDLRIVKMPSIELPVMHLRTVAD